MYRRIYRKAGNNRTANNVVLENLKTRLGKKAAEAAPPPATSEDVEDAAPASNEAEATSEAEVRLCSEPRRYGNRRERPRAAARDVATVESRLDEEGRRMLEEARRQEREMEEAARVEAERLEKLKEEIITVEAVDEQIPENTVAHHTDLYDCTDDLADSQLVLRRGQEFQMTLTFHRPYDKEVDDLYLVFKTGDNPNVHKKTSARIQLTEDDKTNYMTGKKRKWGARIESQSGNAMTISVYSPPDAVIGEWEYGIRTRKGEEEFEFEGKQDLVLLLNPWCEDDEVYMEDTDLLKEYILNQVGSVYYGSAKKVKNKPWNYGQFQKDMLMISLYLLRMANGYAVTTKMADPVFISRALSRIINSSDDDGVLTGRWDGEYGDGVRPLAWKGSPEILRMYWDNDCRAVKYGQCWVFSHLLTTVSRALGLPCRSVTNFSSAHDTDLSMTIDKYVDDDGDEIPYLSGDSVWNFHVWNEVWMRRCDLDHAHGVDGKYDGWQAVDATPQEMSAYFYQCGPSPLAAIKLGDVNVSYDTKFIFGEVNAERCTWLNTEPLTLLKKDSHSVGKKMSTKVPDGKGFKKYYRFMDNKDGRFDVTDQYKNKEGSAAEREAVSRAVGEGRHADNIEHEETGIELTLIEEEQDPDLGEDFELNFKAKNTSNEDRTVTIRANVRPANYWGSILGKERISKKHCKSMKLGPGEDQSDSITVKAEDYLKLCDDSMSMRLLLLARVKDFKDPEVLSEDVVLDSPDIAIEGLPEESSVDGIYDVTISYENPLNKRLTNVKLKIDGSIYVDNDDFKLENAIYVKILGELNPKEKETMTLKCRPMAKPKHSKEREITVTLDCKEIPDMTGTASTTLA